MKSLAWLVVAALTGGWAVQAPAQKCTTQSQMTDADRAGLVGAVTGLAAKVEANDAAGVKASTIAEYQKDFSGMGDAIATTAPKLGGAAAEVEQIYLLDASTMTKTASGANPDAQFFCTLNHSANEAEFSIPQLPPGKYGFAMVRMEAATPWRLSFLLRQDGGQWLLAGFYPKQLTAGGHDGLWYWKQARMLTAGKEPWSGWLYLQEAQILLEPVNFVGSSHLDKLQAELTAAAPPGASGGLSADAPLVVKAPDGSEFRFTAIGVDDSLHADKVDVAAHIKVDTLGDGTFARRRNVEAMTALLAAHPELRKSFHGVWIFAEAPGQSPYATELAMNEIK